MIQNKKNTIFIIGIICLFISTFSFVGYSQTDIQEVVIKSITPVYDSESTIIVNNNNVTFNDKNQTIKYNIVIENTQDYDIQLTDLQLNTPTEEFLKYTIENIGVDDVIKSGESKELVISFETVKMDGWGRNFNDELISTLYFTEVKKEEIIPPIEEPEIEPPENPTDEPTEPPTDPTEPPTENLPEEPPVPPVDEPQDSPTEPGESEENPSDEPESGTKEPEVDFNTSINNNNSDNVGQNNSGNVVISKPENNNQNNGTIESEKQPEEPKDDSVVTPENPEINHELGMNQTIEVEKDESIVLISFVFGIAFGVCGIGLVIVNKNKLSKYLVIVFVISSSIGIAKADKIIELSIPINVSYESQNVMKPSGCVYSPDTSYPTGCSAFWQHRNEIRNVYFQTEMTEIKEYAEKYDVSVEDKEKVVAYLVDAEGYTGYYDLFIQAEGIIYANEDMSYYFAGMRLEEIYNLEVLDTSNVTNMSWIFSGTQFRKTSYTLDLTSFKTSKVTDMKYAFHRLGYNTPTFRVDLSSFDTSNVTDMSYMFNDIAKNSTDFTLDLSSIETNNVTNMQKMFLGAGYNSKNFKLDLSSFDTSNVTNMDYMFFEAGYNSPVFTIDVSSFDTSNVKGMGGMFSSIGHSSQEYTLDVSNFDTSNVTDMSYMFYMNGYSNPNFTLNIDNLDTRNVTSMSGMFSGVAYNNNEFTLDISHFEAPKLLNISWMFSSTGTNSENLTIIFGDFDTSNVGNMEGAFYETGYNTKELNMDLSKLSFKKAYNTSSMFFNTGYNNENLNLTMTIDSPYITAYTSMFSNTAVKPGTKITVNYTKSTKDIVDQMINTKSDGANVVKGWNVGKEISFNIAGTVYSAYDGMTWENWINSNFNTDGFYKDGAYITKNFDDYRKEINSTEFPVYATDLIVENHNYILQDPK